MLMIMVLNYIIFHSFFKDINKTRSGSADRITTNLKRNCSTQNRSQSNVGKGFKRVPDRRPSR